MDWVPRRSSQPPWPDEAGNWEDVLNSLCNHQGRAEAYFVFGSILVNHELALENAIDRE
jgi:hypothetical protein